jgi:phosphoglucomutase
LRIYLEKFASDVALHDQDAQVALAELIELAEQLCEIKKLTGRKEPTVIT